VHRIALAARVANRFKSESGLALVSTLGVACALALASTGVVAFASTNYGSASRSKADTAAFALAEAGINNAASVLNAASDPTNPSLLPSRTAAYEGGTATYSGTFDASTSVWTVTSVGEMRNPTGPNASPVRRTETAKIAITSAATPTQPLSNQAWNYVVATRTGNQCDETLSNSVTWGARLFVAGNLCMSTGATVTAGPLDVGGMVTLGSTDNYIGSSASPVSEVHAVGGCKYSTAKTPDKPCGSSDHVYASVSDTTSPGLTAPSPDWDRWYSSAMPGPRAGCASSSGTVPVFDTDTTRNNSVTSVFSLTPASSYSCTTGTGQLSWDASSRVLTVNGTVFIDGSAKVDNAQVDTYAGEGVIYLSGAFEVSSNTRLCAVAASGDCDFSSWNPNSSLLGVVANGNGGGNVPMGYSITVGSSGRFQGALYGTYGVAFGTSSKDQGPVIGSVVAPCASMQLPPFPLLTTVPSGLPGQPQSSARRPSAPYGFSG
jgi:hypothetical protein